MILGRKYIYHLNIKLINFHTQVSRLHVLLTLLELQFSIFIYITGDYSTGITDLITIIRKEN
jgi:hypothetical protein